MPKLIFYNETDTPFEEVKEEPKLVFYNETDCLFFEVDTYDVSFPTYAVVLDFITGQGGIY